MSLISILIATYSTSKIIFQHKNNSVKVKNSSDAEFIATKAKNLRSKVGQREKLSCDYGIWYFCRAQEDLLYAACVQNQYPQRTAFALIEKMQKLIEEKASDVTAQKSVGKKQKQIKAIFQQYKSNRIDKVKQAQHVVGQLKDELYKGVNKVIKNQDELQSMKARTTNMKSLAMDFQKNAATLQSLTFWNKWRTIAIFSGIGVAAFATIGLVLYIRP